MFLLPSIVLGLVVALLLGGHPSRLGAVALRRGWLVLAALAFQVVLFTDLGASLPWRMAGWAHVASYGLLVGFAASNLHVRALLPAFAGTALNTVVVAINAGHMPLSSAAAAVVGIEAHANTSTGAHRLAFLGDVFALPRQLPFANVFSIGDLLIGLGVAAFIVMVSTADGSEPELEVGRLLRPLRVRRYRLLVAGKLVSHAGDWLTLAALVGWIYHETGSTGQAALLLLLRTAPPILGGGLATVVVDRLPKTRLLPAIELARGMLVAGALAAVLAGSHAGVMVMFAFSGLVGALGQVATGALVPALLPEADLPGANAGLGIARDAAMAVGAAGGGVALAWLGVSTALTIDVATFGLAFLLLAGLGPSAPAAVRRTKKSRRRGVLRGTVGQRRIALAISCFAAATLATGLTNASLPRFLAHLGLGEGGYGYGVAVLAVGLVCGECLVGFARVGPSCGTWIGAGLLLMAGVVSLLALSEQAIVALLLLGAIGVIDGTTDVVYDTLLQREADPRHLGAVFGFSTALISTTMIGGFVAAPVLNAVTSPRAALLAAGGLLVVAGGIGLAGLRTVPALLPAGEPSAARP